MTKISKLLGQVLLLTVVWIIGVPDCEAVAGLNVWTTNGPVPREVLALAIDPLSPSTVYAGATGFGIFKSTDAGGSWTPVNAGLTSPFVVSLAIVPSVPSTIYAGTVAGVFKSTDGAATWSAVNTGLPSTCISGNTVLALATKPASPSTVYAGGYCGVFKSTNAGGSWNAVNNGLPAGSAWSFSIDPLNPSTIYVGTDSGVFKTLNGGESWTAANSGLNAPVRRLAIDPSAPSTLYAGTAFGVYKTTNGGTSWSLLSGGLPDPQLTTASNVLTLVVSPAAPLTVYVGTFYDGAEGRVFRTTNGGASWTPLNEGLPSLSVVSLAIDPTGTQLYAGTALLVLPGGAGDGVYDYETAPPCTTGPNQLCLLENRFRLTLQATDPRTGRVGVGQAIPQGNRFGSFSLPTFTGDPTFPEVVVKMLDATGVPPPLGGFFWLFHTGLTDLQYTLTVTDTLTGAVKTYQNDRSDPGKLCGAADTAAFRN